MFEVYLKLKHPQIDVCGSHIPTAEPLFTTDSIMSIQCKKRNWLASDECRPLSSNSPPLRLTLPTCQAARHPQSPRVLRLPSNSCSWALHTGRTAVPVLLVHTDVTSWEEQRPEANTYLREGKHYVWPSLATLWYFWRLVRMQEERNCSPMYLVIYFTSEIFLWLK